MPSNHMYTCFLRGEPTVTLEGVRLPLSCVLKCPRFRLNISPKQSLPLPFTLVRIPKIGATNYKWGTLTMIRTAQTNRKTHFKGKQDSSMLTPPELCSHVGYSLLGNPSLAAPYRHLDSRLANFGILRHVSASVV
jgi:hypothetical protein